MPTTDDNGPWLVRIKCTVTKEVYCENCTRGQAETDPWEHATSEEETDQEDWEVLSVAKEKN